MPRMTKTYYFGRLNLIASYTNKTDFLRKGLSTESLLEKRKYKWGFFNIEYMASEFGPFFTGYLVKYRTTTDEEVADEQNHVLTIEEAQYRVTAKSRFFLHISSGLIAYRLIGSHISYGQFCECFAELIEMAHDYFFVDAQIQAIDQKYRIFEVIPRFDYIEKVNIYLHPSNPRAGNWKRVDDRLKAINASSYCEEYVGTTDSPLKVQADEDINEKLRMAVDGYGKADIKGKLDVQ